MSTTRLEFLRLILKHTCYPLIQLTAYIMKAVSHVRLTRRRRVSYYAANGCGKIFLFIVVDVLNDRREYEHRRLKFSPKSSRKLYMNHIQIEWKKTNQEETWKFYMKLRFSDDQKKAHKQNSFEFNGNGQCMVKTIVEANPTSTP